MKFATFGLAMLMTVNAIEEVEMRFN